MDQGFLRDVQKAGWHITGVDQLAATVACPRAGCALKVRLKSGAKIPQACASGPELADIAVTTFEDARLALRARREALGLTIKELEEVAGAAVDHLAKAEKDNPSKYPNTQLLIEWATALGFEVVLRPAPMPAMALRYLADSRKQAPARFRMQAHHRARREGGEQSGQE